MFTSQDYMKFIGIVSTILLLVISLVAIGHTREDRRGTERVATAIANLTCETDAACLAHLDEAIEALVSLDANVANRSDTEREAHLAAMKTVIRTVTKLSGGQTDTRPLNSQY